MKILVTGCFGFIASTFIKYTLQNKKDVTIVGFGRNTNQRNKHRLTGIGEMGNVSIVYGDMEREQDLSEILEGIDVIFNFSAKTFVDHSVRDPEPFVRSNIIGTYNLLEAIRRQKATDGKDRLLCQISTDEVYGGILEGEYKENAMMNPTNPYASSKACGDMMCVAYNNTYKIPLLITRTENNYGHYQHPQKVMPAFVKKALHNEKLPVYGDGKQKRMWLRAEDHCSALWLLVDKDARGIYHIAGGQELENIELAKIILKTLNKPETLIEYIDDSKIRPFHDRRYALNTDKLKSLGWSPSWNMEDGIKDAVKWFRDNSYWLE